jgi:hypothetical protein
MAWASLGPPIAEPVGVMREAQANRWMWALSITARTLHTGGNQLSFLGHVIVPLRPGAWDRRDGVSPL